jgi:hypothetical protein
MQPQLAKQGKELIAPGWITGLGPALARCWIKDISNHGATLVFQSGQPPEEFRLYFSPYASTYRMCAVQWRKDDSVGVKFVHGARTNPVAVAPTTSS